MKAMILAAGRGQRLRPLTDKTPKALIEVNGKPLIVHHINQLIANGITDIVINLAYLGEQIKACLGDGKKFGVNIQYSEEKEGGLETGGGIVKALPLLGTDPFLTVNADIVCDYNYATLPTSLGDNLAYLVLTDNPRHNEQGDFSLSTHKVTVNPLYNPYTFAGIALYNPVLFKNCPVEKYSVVPLLKKAVDKGLVSGECHQHHWFDIGTVQRLEEANQYISTHSAKHWQY